MLRDTSKYNGGNNVDNDLEANQGSSKFHGLKNDARVQYIPGISSTHNCQAVDRTIAFTHAHPDQFDLAPEQVNTLAQSVEEGTSDLPSNHPLIMATMRKFVHVMVSVLGDVYTSNLPTSNCSKVN